MKYSFVIPCYNSSKTIGKVVDEINNKMLAMKEDNYEIILVNDSSKDNTRDVIFNLANNSHITAISLAKNCGQHAACLAGYRASSGKYVISLDDDGQTPADEVDILLNKIIEGYDVVFARYPSKKHSWFKNFGSKINDIMACQLINKPKDLYLSSYFVAKRFVIDTIVAYNNPYPYIGGLLLMTTNKLCNVDVHHRSREIGDSGYTFKKLISLWFNGFTSFSVKPLRISMFFGIIVALLGFILTIYSVIRKIQNPEIAQGWASTMSAITVIGGVILIVLGMIGEYIGRIYISINNFPQYVIKEFKKNKMED